MKFKLLTGIKALVISVTLCNPVIGISNTELKDKNADCTKLTCDCSPELLTALGRVAGTKASNNIPLIPLSSDFPSGGINSLTDLEQEQFRKGFTEGLSTKFGEHVGWKFGLTSATPGTPSLGYQNPIYGELLEKMIIVGDNVNVRPDFALATAAEADMLFVIKSSDINFATTPQEVLQNVRGVYPAIELPAGFTPTFLPYLFGPTLNGDGILRVTNIAARIFVRSNKMIPIPGTRSLANWESVLNGGLQVQDLLIRNNSSVGGNGTAIPHLNNMVKLIAMLNAMGLKLKPGDIVSPGTAVATRIADGTEKSFTVTYSNLDPQGQSIIKVNYTADGACCGVTSKPK